MMVGIGHGAQYVWDEEAWHRHHQVSGKAKALWTSGDLTKETGKVDEPAQYDPNLTVADQRQFELETVMHFTGQQRLKELVGEELPQVRSHVQRFYRRMDRIIGASNGQETEYIYIELASGKFFHGRPITKSELRHHKKAQL